MIYLFLTVANMSKTIEKSCVIKKRMSQKSKSQGNNELDKLLYLDKGFCYIEFVSNNLTSTWVINQCDLIGSSLNVKDFLHTTPLLFILNIHEIKMAAGGAE